MTSSSDLIKLCGWKTHQVLTSSTPVESNRLLHHVLLLAPVTCTHVHVYTSAIFFAKYQLSLPARGGVARPHVNAFACTLLSPPFVDVMMQLYSDASKITQRVQPGWRWIQQQQCLIIRDSSSTRDGIPGNVSHAPMMFLHRILYGAWQGGCSREAALGQEQQQGLRGMYVSCDTPTHVKVHVTSTDGIASMSAMVNDLGLETSPFTTTRCSSHLILGTAPWLRTSAEKTHGESRKS